MRKKCGSEEGERRMDFVFRRSYRGPIKLAIFDWAGTTLDYGCLAPAVVFVEVFKLRGVEITMQQARRRWV